MARSSNNQSACWIGFGICVSVEVAVGIAGDVMGIAKEECICKSSEIAGKEWPWSGVCWNAAASVIVCISVSKLSSQV